MNVTQTARVGHTQLSVPKLGLGTAPLANLYETIPEAQAVETIRQALARGVNFFDTAPLYGSGLAERRLALALADVPRDQYVLATKIGRLVRPDGSIVFDYSRDGVLRSLEASLKRLQLDRVDILHIHEPEADDEQALREAFPTLAALREQGVIQAIGAGMNRWQAVADFVREVDFDCFLLAGRYTLLEQGALEFLALCQEKGISLFLAGVYNSGILASGPRPGAKYNYRDAPPEIVQKAQHLVAICHRHQIPLNVAALQFAMAHPATTALVVGAASAAEVRANIEALQRPLPSELWQDLKTAGLLHQAAPVPK